MRVKIVGNHPHSGCTGEVIACKQTLAGKGVEIKLDELHNGAEGCFVFRPENIVVLTQTKGE
jgi:hypothetical protein